MANFQTHLNGGILVSAATTLSLHMAGLIPGGQTMPLFTLGVIGSLLPDIDSDTSRPVGLLFNVLGCGLAFAMTMPLTHLLLPMELALVWAGVFLCVRYGFFEIFTRFTVHRGVWHSWLGIAATALATTNLAYWMWDQTPIVAWLAGLMVGVGYLTHLCLDELFSVDLFNGKLKRSFGTALKPFSLDSPLSSVAMAMVIVVLAWKAPPTEGILREVDLDPAMALNHLGERVQIGLDWAASHAREWWAYVARYLSLG